jgi:hypothetical protein
MSWCPPRGAQDRRHPASFASLLTLAVWLVLSWLGNLHTLRHPAPLKQPKAMPRAPALRAGADSPEFVIGPVGRGAVFQLGVRLTVESDKDVFVDFFTLPREPLADKLNHRIDFVPGNSARAARGFNKSRLMSWNSVKALSRTCSVDRKTYPMWSMNSAANDINTRHRLHVWRCHVSHLGRASVAMRAQFQVSISFLNDTLAFVIPRRTLSLGLAGPVNLSQTSVPIQPFSNLTVCLGMISSLRGAQATTDWIKHHARLGVDHVVLGVLGSQDSDLALDLQRRLQRTLANGTCTLWYSPSDLVFHDNDDAKFQFYQACLFHAKAVSRFVGAWDLDEWWVPNDLSSYFDPAPTHRPGALANVLQQRAADWPACPDWCFITFPSKNIVPRWAVPREVHGFKPNKSRRNPVDFTLAEEVQWHYKKSIARPRNIFILGFHSPGACITSQGVKLLDSPFTRDHVSHFPTGNDCALVGADAGVFNHYWGQFRYLDRNQTAVRPCPFAQRMAEVGHLRVLDAIEDDRCC